MRALSALFLLLTAAVGFFSFDSNAVVQIPELTAPVADEAGILSSGFERKLNASLKEVLRQGGPQIGVLTLKDIEDESIEQTSFRVVDKWLLGDKEKDNGVLILIAQKQKRARIEVGQGLEGLLTDFESSRILHQIMLPLFKRGEVESGVLLGVARVVQTTAPELNIDQIFASSGREFAPSGSDSQPGGRPWGAIIVFIIGAFLFIRYPRLFILLLLSGRSRGGGGFGGGGFGGGGGGFSGGGASGGW